MTKSPLVPTPIIDRNGKHTTVHRKVGETRSSAAAIPAAAVASPAAAVQHETTFYLPAWIREKIAAGAPGRAMPAEKGSAVLTDDDAFAYLSVGLSLEWGAAMHSVHPDPDHWASTEQARDLANHRSRWPVARPAAAAVELMREAGQPPKDVERMLDNGLADAHLRGALTAEQTAVLFSTVRCVPSPLSLADDTAAMVRYLTDGTMPFSLVENGMCSQESLIGLADFMRKSLTDERDGRKSNGFRAAAEADPEVWLTMAKLMDFGHKKTAASRAWKTLRVFGTEMCLRFPVSRLLSKTDAGVPEGEVIRQAHALGMSYDAYDDAMRANDNRTSAVLAIARGESAPAIADGWL